jgi:uncharacterized lipoprotein YajG
MWCAKWICKARIPGSFALSVLIAVVFLTGCAEKGPILLTVGYQATAEKARTASTIVVGVSPFRDVRGVQPSVLGKRTIPSGMQNDLVVQGTVAEMATISLKEALTRRGISVKDVADWDLTAEGIQAEGAALVLGGEIKVLWLESTATAFNTNLKASVQLKVYAGDTGEKKVVRTIDVSSKLEQEVLYSRELLENMLSEALTSAIDQIFKDEELKKRF